MMRSTYDWGQQLGVVWIEDLDEGARSVTNDIELVIADLVRLGVQLEAQPIIYCDSMGQWDQVVTRGGRFHSFQSLGGARSFDLAVSRVLESA